VNIADPVGCMVVDIGGGTTEIAIISLAGIACNQSIKVAGNAFNMDILDHMRKQHNLLIGERTAEQIKLTIGAVWTDLNDPPPDYAVYGKDLLTGIPKIISVSYRAIATALEESISKIDNAVLKALEMAPPELASDIYKNGIHLVGGGALLRGLDKRLHSITNLPVHIAEDPLQAVVRGTGIALKNKEIYRSVLMG
jgi:rod shape-determining protein MreB